MRCTVSTGVGARACVAASGKEDAHARSPMYEETGLPIVSLDYEFLEGKVTIFIAKDYASGAVVAYACVENGPADQCVVRQFIRDLYD